MLESFIVPSWGESTSADPTSHRPPGEIQAEATKCTEGAPSETTLLPDQTCAMTEFPSRRGRSRTGCSGPPRCCSPPSRLFGQTAVAWRVIAEISCWRAVCSHPFGRSGGSEGLAFLLQRPGHWAAARPDRDDWHYPPIRTAVSVGLWSSSPFRP